MMRDKDQLLDKVLVFLGVEKEEPSLALLNKLIEQHQRRVTWENVSKILDWEEGHKRGNFLPAVETYFERMIQHGFGGTCWTIAVGFHWILQQLQFNVSYLYMDSGHLCLRVDLEQEPYYVDLGYSAPLYQAYPLFTSFQTQNERETFDYQVNNGEITVIRTPGPTKTLSPKPVTLAAMQPYIHRSNQWETSPVLNKILIFGYIDGVPTSITNRQLKQHFEGEKIEKELSNEELEYWIKERFRMNWEMYKKGIEIFEARKVSEPA